MKNKYFWGLMLLLSLPLFDSCKKDKATNITSHLYSPAIQICQCGGDKYMLDLDFDGKPDIELSMACVNSSFLYTNNNCGGTYVEYSYSASAIVDTVLNSLIFYRLSAYKPGDTINYFSSYTDVSGGNLISYFYEYNSTPHTDTFYNIPPSGSQYFAFAKEAATGFNYGWFSVHLDSAHHLYLDGIAISNNINTAILAGQH